MPLLNTSLAVTLCLIALASALGLSGAAAGQSSPASQHYFLCQISVKVSGSINPTAYISPVFPSDLIQSSTVATRIAIGNAWDKYVINKYAPDQQNLLRPPSTHCSPGNQGALKDVHDRALKSGAVEVDWKYTPDQTGAASAQPAPAAGASPPGTSSAAAGKDARHPASQMSAEVRQAIEEEATRAVSVCKDGGLRSFYPHPGTTVEYDCTCFSQKVREYRMNEYDRVGERILNIYPPPHRLKVLEPQFAELLSPRSNPQVDFRSCSLPPKGPGKP